MGVEWLSESDIFDHILLELAYAKKEIDILVSKCAPLETVTL